MAIYTKYFFIIRSKSRHSVIFRQNCIYLQWDWPTANPNNERRNRTMNYEYGNRFSAPRRKTYPSTPDERFIRENILSCSDMPMHEQPARSYCANKSQQCPSSRERKSLAMVYSPKQEFCNLYDEDTALFMGTLFQELNLPFEGSKCGKDRC